jgi:hypothetical protein
MQDASLYCMPATRELESVLMGSHYHLLFGGNIDHLPFSYAYLHTSVYLIWLKCNNLITKGNGCHYICLVVVFVIN